VSFVKVEQEDDLRQIEVKGIIGKITLAGEDGLLIDAVYEEKFRNNLFRNLKKGRKIKVGSNNLVFNATVKDHLKGEQEISSKIQNAEQSNTSIIYNGKYFMKLYRKIDNTLNPDLELTRFLT